MKTNIKYISSAICLIIFSILVIGSGGNDEEVEAEIGNKAAEAKMSATQLWTEYDDNEVLADENYKGKILEVSGVIEDIAKDFSDDIYVDLKGNSAQYSSHQSVRCYFSDDHVKAASKLTKGQSLTVKGKCDGKSVLDVVLRGSQIVQ